MKVVEIVDVNSKDFYNELISSFKREFKTTYVKEGQKVKSKSNEIEVIKLIENECYSIKIKTIYGVNFIEYFLKDINESKLKVVYNEKFKANTLMYSLNYSIMQVLFFFRLRRRAKLVIRSVEKKIIEERGKL